jgi:hypothetical protein
MRRLGRRTGWLGWAVAAVLLLSAGGVALAAQPDSPTTTQAPGQADSLRKAGAPGLRGLGWRRGLARRALHGEVTVQTKDGVQTWVAARGEVTELTDDRITIKSSDGVTTSFRIDGDTRFGFRNQPEPTAELKVGDQGWVVGTKSGDSNLAKRVVTGQDLPQRAPGGSTP